MNADELVLGVDGGGTKTVVWLAKADDVAAEPVGKGAGGATNPGVVGAKQALETLDQAIDAAFADLGVRRGRVAAASLAISGTERSAHRETILQWAADTQLARHLEMINDAEAVIAAGLPDRWGVALIAGTGSFALGRNRSGQTVRVGGWGYLFGDEGSGQAIGTAGLRAATQWADGRGPQTSLLPRFLDWFKVAEARELITVMYTGAGELRQRAAQLAPIVGEAAQQGDGVAAAIVRQAAADLARMVVAASARLERTSSHLPLALAGGVLCHCALVRESLLVELASCDCTPSPMTLVEHPVQGAVNLARRAAARRQAE